MLDRFRRTGTGLWLLAPLFLIWINLHGSWVYGMVVLVLTFASGLVQGEMGISRVAATLESSGTEKAAAAGIRRLGSSTFYQSIRLQSGDVPALAFLRMQGFMQYVEYWRPVDFSTWNAHAGNGHDFCRLLHDGGPGFA